MASGPPAKKAFRCGSTANGRRGETPSSAGTACFCHADYWDSQLSTPCWATQSSADRRLVSIVDRLGNPSDAML
jgi:hypothetical protein